MNVVISDYPDVLGGNTVAQRAIFERELPGCTVTVAPFTGDGNHLSEILSGADVLLTAFLPVTEKLLERCRSLRCITVNAAGYDTIDTAAAAGRHIAVMAVEEYCTDEVANHTMALILALARKLKQYTESVEQERRWHSFELPDLHRIRGTGFGIFGTGRIGMAVARRALAFGWNVYAWNGHCNFLRSLQAAGDRDALRIKTVPAERIYETCSVISNHMQQTPDTIGFFDCNAFSAMKMRPYFINCSRGGAVDGDALYNALRDGRLRGAALDVFDSEHPDLQPAGNAGRFLGMKNVLITPHAAFYSEESCVDLQRISCMNAVYFLRGEQDRIHKIVNGILPETFGRQEMICHRPI